MCTCPYSHQRAFVDVEDQEPLPPIRLCSKHRDSPNSIPKGSKPSLLMKPIMLPLHRTHTSFQIRVPKPICSSRYRKLLSRFDTNIRDPDSGAELPQLPHLIPIIGFSATFSRHDGLALGSVFERIVYHRDFLEMIKEQW